MKRLILTILLLNVILSMSILSLFPPAAARAETSDENTEETYPSEIQIIEKDGKQWLNIDDQLCIYVDSIADAAAIIRQELDQHTTAIRLAYGAQGTYDSADLWNKIDQAVYGTTDMDYLKLLSSADQVRIVDTGSTVTGDSGKYDVIFYECKPDYYASAKENSTAQAQIDKALKGLSLKDSSDYTKIKKIYKYICSHVSYDWDYNSASFSSYGAIVKKKAVCQGYAMLLYQFAKKAGLKCGIVCGKAKDGDELVDHVWNVVKLGGSYYYLDPTWDGMVSRYHYFLKGSDKFMKDHKGSGAYKVSKSDYKLPADDKFQYDASYDPKVSKVTIKGISHKIARGRKIKLTATITPKDAPKTLKWTSSNKKIATVSSTGKVKINKKAAGKKVIIRATAGNGKKAAWKIRVMKGIVKKISIKGARKTLKKGKTLKLKAKVKATKKANTKLRWISSNKKAASVNSKGKVKALKKGYKVKITAMSTDGSGKKKSVYITIK